MIFSPVDRVNLIGSARVNFPNGLPSYPNSELYATREVVRSLVWLIRDALKRSQVSVWLELSPREKGPNDVRGLVLLADSKTHTAKLTISPGLVRLRGAPTAIDHPNGAAIFMEVLMDDIEATVAAEATK